MTSAFSAFDTMLSAAEDAWLGESVLFIPKQRVDNWGKPTGSADGRQSIAMVGSFIEGAVDIDFLSGDKRNADFAGQFIKQEAWISIDRRAFPGDSQPQKGDQLKLTDQPRQPTFEILDVLNYGPSRFAFPLVRA